MISGHAPLQREPLADGGTDTFPGTSPCTKRKRELRAVSPCGCCSSCQDTKIAVIDFQFFQRPMQTNRQLLRRLHDLRYRELPGLVNRQITITSFESTGTEIKAVAQEHVPSCGDLELCPGNIRGTVGKYKIMDLTFALAIPVLSPADRVDRQGLVELGFLSAKDEEPPSGSEDRDPTCLEELVEAMASEKESLKIFLQAMPIGNAMEELFDEVVKIQATGLKFDDATAKAIVQRADSLFPGKFIILDACITNSDFVWILKHFYL